MENNNRSCMVESDEEDEDGNILEVQSKTIQTKSEIPVDGKAFDGCEETSTNSPLQNLPSEHNFNETTKTALVANDKKESKYYKVAKYCRLATPLCDAIMRELSVKANKNKPSKGPSAYNIDKNSSEEQKSPSDHKNEESNDSDSFQMDFFIEGDEDIVKIEKPEASDQTFFPLEDEMEFKDELVDTNSKEDIKPFSIENTSKESISLNENIKQNTVDESRQNGLQNKRKRLSMNDEEDSSAAFITNHKNQSFSLSVLKKRSKQNTNPLESQPTIDETRRKNISKEKFSMYQKSFEKRKEEFGHEPISDVQSPCHLAPSINNAGQTIEEKKILRSSKATQTQSSQMATALINSKVGGSSNQCKPVIVLKRIFPEQGLSCAESRVRSLAEQVSRVLKKEDYSTVEEEAGKLWVTTKTLLRLQKQKTQQSVEPVLHLGSTDQVSKTQENNLNKVLEETASEQVLSLTEKQNQINAQELSDSIRHLLLLGLLEKKNILKRESNKEILGEVKQCLEFFGVAEFLLPKDKTGIMALNEIKIFLIDFLSSFQNVFNDTFFQEILPNLSDIIMLCMDDFEELFIRNKKGESFTKEISAQEIEAAKKSFCEIIYNYKEKFFLNFNTVIYKIHQSATKRALIISFILFVANSLFIKAPEFKRMIHRIRTMLVCLCEVNKQSDGLFCTVLATPDYIFDKELKRLIKMILVCQSENFLSITCPILSKNFTVSIEEKCESIMSICNSNMDVLSESGSLTQTLSSNVTKVQEQHNSPSTLPYSLTAEETCDYEVEPSTFVEVKPFITTDSHESVEDSHITNKQGTVKTETLEKYPLTLSSKVKSYLECEGNINVTVKREIVDCDIETESLEKSDNFKGSSSVAGNLEILEKDPLSF